MDKDLIDEVKFTFSYRPTKKEMQRFDDDMDLMEADIQIWADAYGSAVANITYEREPLSKINDLGYFYDITVEVEFLKSVEQRIVEHLDEFVYRIFTEYYDEPIQFRREEV